MVMAWVGRWWENLIYSFTLAIVGGVYGPMIIVMLYERVIDWAIIVKRVAKDANFEVGASLFRFLF